MVNVSPPQIETFLSLITGAGLTIIVAVIEFPTQNVVDGPVGVIVNVTV